MYCPRCRAEYREGFTLCADCDEPLVEELPPEPTDSKSALPDLVVIYEAPIPDAELMRSVLEGSGITSAIQSGQNAAYPVTVGELGFGQVWVRRSEAERAREVIEAALQGDLDIDEVE